MKARSNILSFRYLISYSVVVLLLFPRFTILQQLSIIVFLHQVVSLFLSIGKGVPIRSLMGTLFCLQLLIGPVIAYNGGDGYVLEVYKMRVKSEEYFSYVLPATLLFLFGLNIASRNRGEILNIREIAFLGKTQPMLPYYLIVVGFIGEIILTVASSELKFFFYLVGSLRYCGVFIAILSEQRFKLWPILLVYGYLLVRSFGYGMFHDFLTWTIFLGAILALRYKVKNLPKLGIFCGFFVTALFIQFIKSDFRESLSLGSSATFETVTEVYNTTTSEKGSMFSVENLLSNSIRINQGYIVSNILYHVPQSEAYSNGSVLKQIWLSAILPRFLYPDKINAGDQEIFRKFTGLQIAQNTSMALSSVGDAYANFGKEGGMVFMFFYGLLFNLTLIFLHYRGKSAPVILLFAPVIFVYPIRPDCELQTILGHLVKSLFLVVVIFHWFKDKLTVYFERTYRSI